MGQYGGASLIANSLGERALATDQLAANTNNVSEFTVEMQLLIRGGRQSAEPTDTRIFSPLQKFV